ncbi:MAG: penicillin-binding transpeptidase domain-containing protein [Gemmatimonadota bacterium]
MRPARASQLPGPWRRRVILGGWLTLMGIICLRAVHVQVLQGAEWRHVAEAQHTTDKTIPAPRGTILDRDGTPLAVSRETYRVSVAPREVRDLGEARRVLAEATGLPPRRLRALVRADARWSVLPGRYSPAVRQALAGMRGVYLEREFQRFHPHGDLARGVLGTVLDGEGRGGVEQAFDNRLRGRDGRQVVARDNVGRPIPGETYVVERPRTGGSVVLTLDMDLQEIARQALEEAIENSEARGGDVLVTDPHTGEVLALVSIRDGQTAALSAINTPYEPGSTLKPFTVAGLLSAGLVSLSDSVDVGEGSWRVAGRTLHDVHAEGRMTVADALRVSSNVGIAKVASAFTPGQQYEILRDFGFGVPTGIEIPGEVGGTLRRPNRWSAQSPVSLAIGYEISVTPLQMAMAYGALANGGVLMQARLVREVRDAGGEPVERFEPVAVRRVVDPRVARMVSRVLVDVVEDGTGTRARMGAFRVAGKSGTSRAYSVDDGYQSGAYYSSFVGFFPADDPQLVVLVKLDRPKGSYYGGSVAAPVTRTTMEAALAARATPLDRARLLRSVRGRVELPAASAVRFAAQPIDPPAPPTTPSADPALATARGAGGANVSLGGVPLPDVMGLPARVAARRLHGLGLRVELDDVGEIVGSRPAPGVRVAPGDTVHLLVERRGHD